MRLLRTKRERENERERVKGIRRERGCNRAAREKSNMMTTVGTGA